MSYNVVGTTITLTRGDTFMAQIAITDSDNNPYIPVTGDTIRFAAKVDYVDASPVLVKEIPIDTLKLTLVPEDTKSLAFGSYVYDIQLTKVSGEVEDY